MENHTCLSFCSDVELVNISNQKATLKKDNQLISIALQFSSINWVLRNLSAGIDFHHLEETVLDQSGPGGLAYFYTLFKLLCDSRLVNLKLIIGDDTVAIAYPMSRRFDYSNDQFSPNKQYFLEECICIYPDDNTLVLECPPAWVRLSIRNERIFQELSQFSTTINQGSNTISKPGCDTESVVNNFLLRIGIIHKSDSYAAGKGKDLTMYETMFHLHTHKTPFAHNVGAYILGDNSSPNDNPSPPFKDPMSDTCIHLSNIIRQTDQQSDTGFFDVLNKRKTIRTGSSQPISLSELALFLYRSFNNKDIKEKNGDILFRRPYPSGGARQELEIYVLANDVDKLDRGIYHYSSEKQALYILNKNEQLIDEYILDAVSVMGGEAPPPNALLLMATRIRRLTTAYRGLSYRISLMNAGAALQTMYLIATAMKLAPCAIGSANTQLFELATGVEPFDELPIGGFALSRTIAQ
ncbi:MAG: SagB family peptide dehydrogenase [Candidatus Thiodiazotropha endolucinida]